MADPAHAPALAEARDQAMNGSPPKRKVSLQELSGSLAALDRTTTIR